MLLEERLCRPLLPNRFSRLADKNCIQLGSKMNRRGQIKTSRVVLQQ